jgi:hypothetical protein
VTRSRCSVVVPSKWLRSPARSPWP